MIDGCRSGRWPARAAGTMARVTVRPVLPGPLLRLGPADAGEVLTLQRAAYVPQARLHADIDIPPLTEGLDELTAVLAAPDVLTLGVREDGRLVATVRVRVGPGEEAELGRLAVAPDRQGRGLGTALLLAAERALPPAVRVLRLFTGEHSADNLRLYERHGYRETHRRRAPTGTHDVVFLAKDLPPAGPAV